jgi:hypothetical protein
MQRTKEPKSNSAKQGWSTTGVLVNEARWTELRKVALDQKRTAAEVLDDAISLYLKSGKVAGLFEVKKKR